MPITSSLYGTQIFKDFLSVQTEIDFIDYLSKPI